MYQTSFLFFSSIIMREQTNSNNISYIYIFSILSVNYNVGEIKDELTYNA